MTKKIKQADAVDLPLYGRVREILDAARANIARTVNTTQVVANWLIGREIVEEEQRGKKRAGYGETLLADLSARLTVEFGRGWSLRQLEYCRSFYCVYSALINMEKTNAVRSIFTAPLVGDDGQITNAVRAELPESWQPGALHPHLSWTHYRTLLRVGRFEARNFYEIEAIHNAWSARELERQISSLLFDRLAKSQDKKGLLRLAVHGQEIT